jgi:sentrin-specific protease 1
LYINVSFSQGGLLSKLKNKQTKYCFQKRYSSLKMSVKYEGMVYRRCYGTQWTYCKNGKYGIKQTQCTACFDFLVKTNKFIRLEVYRQGSIISNVMARTQSKKIVQEQFWSCLLNEEVFIHHFASLLQRLSLIKVSKKEELRSLLRYVPIEDRLVSDTYETIEEIFDQNNNSCYFFKKNMDNQSFSINMKGTNYFESITHYSYLVAASYAYDLIESREILINSNMENYFQCKIDWNKTGLMSANDINVLNISNNTNEKDDVDVVCMTDADETSVIAIDENNFNSDVAITNVNKTLPVEKKCNSDVIDITDIDEKFPDENIFDCYITDMVDSDVDETSVDVVHLSDVERKQLLIRARFNFLTTEEYFEYNSLCWEPANQRLLIDKFATPMTQEKIICLRPRIWLNDEVINFYMILLEERDKKLIRINPSSGRIMSHYFNSFFMEKLLGPNHDKYAYSNVERWTKKFDIFARDKIFIPINISKSHWTIAVLFMKIKEIHYYDSSMDDLEMKYLEELRHWLIDDAKAKKGLDLDTSDWKLIPQPQCPQQANGFDCGVFSIMIADFLTDDLPVMEGLYSQINMPYFRSKIMRDILRGKLNYPIF